MHLNCSLCEHQILNTLCKARDWICMLTNNMSGSSTAEAQRELLKRNFSAVIRGGVFSANQLNHQFVANVRLVSSEKVSSDRTTCESFWKSSNVFGDKRLTQLSPSNPTPSVSSFMYLSRDTSWSLIKKHWFSIYLVEKYWIHWKFEGLCHCFPYWGSKYEVKRHFVIGKWYLLCFHAKIGFSACGNLLSFRWQSVPKIHT